MGFKHNKDIMYVIITHTIIVTVISFLEKACEKHLGC